MTPEQTLARATRARLNGRKSRGPITPSGKYRSSLNAIATAKNLKTLHADIPEFVALLTTDEIQAYRALFQNHVRQLQPQSPCELTLVRQLTAELFQYHRLVTLETTAHQYHIDEILRQQPHLAGPDLYFHAYHAGLAFDKMNRSIQRDKKAKLAAYHGFLRALKQLRQQSPEPLVTELLEIAERVKNEPTFDPPLFVLELLENEKLMSEIAPDYDPRDLLELFNRKAA